MKESKGMFDKKTWVALWGNAMSIVTHQPQQYAKHITLRYPITCALGGDRVRLTLDNFTGSEAVRFARVSIAKGIGGADIDASTSVDVTFHGQHAVTLASGEQKQSDAMAFSLHPKDVLMVSIYLQDVTHLRCGVLTQGVLSEGYFAEGEYCDAGIFPHAYSAPCEWVYFLKDVEVQCEKTCKAIVCYGDSITAQNWPDDLQQMLLNAGKPVSVIRRGVSGSRVLREYTCVPYEAYGQKGSTRFPHELPAAGSDTLIILQGINDIIHPVGADVNEFRPWSDLPTAQELIAGLKEYVVYAKQAGKTVYMGTLSPIEGWRTYAPFREELREAVNAWIRNNDMIDGVIDFDKALRDAKHPHRLQEEMDSGDHLHPSAQGYRQMAKTAYEALQGFGVI